MIDFAREPGYRWYYVDAVVGDRLVVVIFMRAPVFSARELARERRGEPSAFAINAAIYRGGQREAWVCCEFPHASISAQRIAIGASSLQLSEREITVHLEAPQSPWPRALAFDLTLAAAAPAAGEVVLDRAHRWQALMPRARATLTMNGQRSEGHGYHDTNFGRDPLGVSLARWRWSRVHGTDATDIYYDAPACSVHLRATAQASRLKTRAAPACESDTSGWGLPLPRTLTHAGDELSSGQLIESSPFYARLWHPHGELDALTEVADFARFRSPLFSWMSYFRSRAVAA